MLTSMRFLLFLCGISVLALGGAALGSELIDHNQAMGFLVGALSLGGGLIISGLFSIRWYWHGLLGGGIMALLGFGRGVLNLPNLLHYLRGDRETGPLPVLETAITVISLLLLVATFKAVVAERHHRLLEQMEKEEREEEERKNAGVTRL